LSKAFDKVNLSRPVYHTNKKNVNVLVQLLGLLENVLFAIFVSSARTSVQISSQLSLMYARAQIALILFAVFLNELSDTCNLDRNRFIVVYADDILLISPSVVNQNLIHLYERELNLLDMAINWKTYCCLYTYWTTM